MIVGVFEEARRGVPERRVGFEPSRAERVRIWAVCLTLGALAQLGVVAWLMPVEAPRYVVQLDVSLCGHVVTAEVTLSNRDEMGFRMLVG
ncbi:MAG TPA: RimK/LysX family protein, partial [Myxococcota bacterium]|nr:RimK/LysX family protein [Myxococcota bacterium]